MTVISDRVEDVGGVGDDVAAVVFFTEVLRDNTGGDAIVTTRRHDVHPVGGEFTSPDLDPGPAVVQVGVKRYDIIIPVSSSAVRLWPLIDAGMPTPPSVADGFVRNGGGVTRIEAVTQAVYNSLTTPDPATFYLITDS